MYCPSTGSVQVPDPSLVNVCGATAGFWLLFCRLSQLKSVLGTRPVPVIVTLVPTGTVNGLVCPFTCNTIGSDGGVAVAVTVGSAVLVAVGVGSASHVITTQFERRPPCSNWYAQVCGVVMNCPSTGNAQFPDPSLVNVAGESGGLLQLSCRLSNENSLLGTSPVAIRLTLV